MVWAVIDIEILLAGVYRNAIGSTIVQKQLELPSLQEVHAGERKFLVRICFPAPESGIRIREVN